MCKSMMMLLIVMLVSVMMFGCNNGGGSDENNPYNGKIRSWQNRELPYHQNPNEFFGGYETPEEITEAIKKLVSESSVIQSIKDPDDYWQTSQETINSGQGDCEDIAAYWYRLIRDEEIVADWRLTILIVHIPGFDPDHTIVKIALNDKTNLYIDNRNIRKSITWELIAEYDLWNIY